MRPMKIVVVGDDNVGKTSLLITFAKNKFPEEYKPNFSYNDIWTVKIEEIDYNFTLWDTANQGDYDSMRPLIYLNADCFLVCYAIDNQSSFEHVQKFWIPDIRHCSQHTPIILVGTKSDLRTSEIENLITTYKGKELKNLISANSFVECSAKNKLNLHKVFEYAVRAVIKKPEVIDDSYMGRCQML